MNLHGVVFAIDVVLGRGVEVELSKVVGLAVADEVAVGNDLKRAAEVEELSTKGVVVHIEGEAVAGDGGDGTGVDVDGGLVGALGAHLVADIKTVPAQGALGLVEAELGDISTFLEANAARPEGGGVVAEGSGHGEEGGKNKSGLHDDDWESERWGR